MEQAPFWARVALSVLLFAVTAEAAAASGSAGARSGALTVSSLAARQDRVELLVGAEKEALAAQQRALEALVSQEADLVRQQLALQAQQKQLLATVGELAAQAKARGSRSASIQTSAVESSGTPLWFGFGVLDTILVICVYVVCIVTFGWIYGTYYTYKYPSLRSAPVVSTDRFTFALLDGFHCDPDWRIFVFSCFCTGIRWADTVSSDKIDYVRFWPGLITFSVLLASVSLTYGVSLLLLVALTARGRQRIRKAYGLQHGTFITWLEDIFVWSLMGPCATMQEALQAEFVDLPEPQQP